MWNFQRIICIWICCVSCMFGTTQLSSLVRAVPYEYFDDHEQSFYDLDSEQIQAKYDTRLLSQQMLQTQQQQQHFENLNGFHGSVRGFSTNDADVLTLKTKLPNNDGHTLDTDAIMEDDDDERSRDWLGETATKAAAFTTTTIAETLDELHLPRAASCFTNGHKFTHGQKVPRLDNCEVCLCMDGEIFCWWEKCDKKPTKASTTLDDYSTPMEESSTTRIQLNPKTTFKTTLKPLKKPKAGIDYKYDDDDSAEVHEIQQDYESIKSQLVANKEQHRAESHEQFLNNPAVKKKMYLQLENEKYNRKINEQKKNKQNKKKMEEEHGHEKHKQQKQHKNNEQHHHVHNHSNNNRNNNHDYSSSGSSSKILNFPENLPSVLYYDYKTEEHHQHQHQHHEQHLKHQKQKLQQQQQQQQLLRQHENELKQQHQTVHINRHHEYGQDFSTYSGNSKVDKTLSADKITGNGVAAETKHHTRSDGSSTTFKYFGNGNENNYDEDLQTDSDILPEPPTKKPKIFTSIAGTPATERPKPTKSTSTSISHLNRLPTSMMPTADGSDAKTTTTTTTTTSSTLTHTSSAAPISIKKQMLSPWDYNRPNRDKTNSNDNNGKFNSNNNNKSHESSEDILDTDDQDKDDDAFHRWLTSTETNNKNNFTLSAAVIGRDDFGLEVAAADDGILDANNNDYDVDERNYENMDLETNTGRSLGKELKPWTVKGAATTTAVLDTLNMFEEAGAGVVDAITNENVQKPKNEQNSSANKNNKSHSKGIIYGNDKSNSNSNSDNNNNIPFNSNSFDMNSRISTSSISSSSSSATAISSTATSNEENGVSGVVNIDIMLTASSADLQQQPQDTNIKTTSQQRQLQLPDTEHEEQKFIQSPALISNTNNADNNNNALYSITNDNNRNFSTDSNNSNNWRHTNIASDGRNTEQHTQLHKVGVNLSSSSNNLNNNSANSQNLSSSSDSFTFKRITGWLSQTNSTPAAVTPPLSTTLGPERQCNVMGTLYKIGDILPQDTGNCLQCICIDGSTSDDTPRVTCSPHNCPPLVLPDLFDATGY